MSSKEQLPRRTFLKLAGGLVGSAVLNAFLGEHAKAAEVNESEAKEIQSKGNFEWYVDNASKHGVFIEANSIAADQQYPYTYLCECMEYWGIIDGNLVLSRDQKEPLLSVMAYEFGFNHPPIFLYSDELDAPELPLSFTWQGKNWSYVLDSESAETQGKRYVLTNTEGATFEGFSEHNSLQEAVDANDWSSKLDSEHVASETQALFGYSKEKDLLKPDSFRFVFTDGVHPSNLPNEKHEIYPRVNMTLGVGETRFSKNAFHSITTPSAAQILLGTSEFNSVSMEEKDALNFYIENRWKEVQEAEARGEKLPIDIINNSFDMIENGFLRILREKGETIDLEKLGLLVINTTSNEDEVKDDSLDSCVFAVTSPDTQRKAGYVLPEKANGHLFEFPETVPGIEALPMIKKTKGQEAEIAWAFKPLEKGAGGVSFAGIQVTLLAGIVTSVLSTRLEYSTLTYPTVEQVQEAMFNICPLEVRERNGIEYHVRAFKMEQFEKFVNNESDVSLPSIKQGENTIKDEVENSPVQTLIPQAKTG